jgi:hypothetical protein
MPGITAYMQVRYGEAIHYHITPHRTCPDTQSWAGESQGQKCKVKRIYAVLKKEQVQLVE